MFLCIPGSDFLFLNTIGNLPSFQHSTDLNICVPFLKYLGRTSQLQHHYFRKNNQDASVKSELLYSYCIPIYKMSVAGSLKCSGSLLLLKKKTNISKYYIFI